MEHNVDLVHQAETVWLHYDELLNKKELETPEYRNLIQEQEKYWREIYLRLTEPDADSLLESVGIKVSGAGNNPISHE